MCYEKQVAWTNGFVDTVYNVEKWDLGCKPDIGWLRWTCIKELGSLWRMEKPRWDASQLRSQPKAPTTLNLAWMSQPSPLHWPQHTDHCNWPYSLDALGGTTAIDRVTRASSNSRTTASDWPSQDHLLEVWLHGNLESKHLIFSISLRESSSASY